MLVRMWMTRNPVAADPKAPAANALGLMQQRGFRRLPVVEEGRLVGIVTEGTLTSALQYYAGRFDKAAEKRDFGRLKVESCMTPSPFTVSPGSTLEDAARLMRERKVGGLPVVEKGKLVGILTESDLFRALGDILGFGQPGTRVTCLLGHDAEALYEIVRLARAHGLGLNVLATVRHYSPTHRMVVLHVDGPGAAEFLRELEAGQVQILNVAKV